MDRCRRITVHLIAFRNVSVFTMSVKMSALNVHEQPPPELTIGDIVCGGKIVYGMFKKKETSPLGNRVKKNTLY